MTKQDMVWDSKLFNTKVQAQAWIKKRKEESRGSGMGVVRHTIKEVLHDPNTKWEATLYTRGKKTK
jgi:hypothetical protein